MNAEIALILWMLVSPIFFALFSPVRAFLLTYILGILFLPVELHYGITYQGSIALSQSLHIDRVAACSIGVILGTLLFTPAAFTRFRLHWVDAAYGAVLVGMFITSMLNGVGAKDGLSVSFDELREYLPVILLTRIHIRTADDLYQAVRWVLGGALFYVLICVGEFRFAPQTHRLIYGYFQHSFAQFMRYGHFRPVGFFHHAIELSFFMGTNAGLAAWLWYKGLLKKPMWGFVPGWAVLVSLLVGLAVTMTMAGYAAFLICVGMFGLVALLRSRWLLLVLPVAAIIWMTGRYTNTIDASSLLKVAGMVDPVRSESLDYRLEAERLNIAAASQNLFFGKSAMIGAVRREDGSFVMAVDAWWLIKLVFYGLVGLSAWYLVWSAGLLTALFHWRRLTPDLQTLAIGIGILTGAQFIDFLFNAFPSDFLLILNMGLISTIQNYRRVAVAQPARPFLVPPEMVMEGVPGL